MVNLSKIFRELIQFKNYFKLIVAYLKYYYDLISLSIIGNNREIPDYFRLSKIGVNELSYNNKFTASKPLPLCITDNIVNTVNKFSQKNRMSLAKNLKISGDYFTDPNYHNNLLFKSSMSTVSSKISLKNNTLEQKDSDIYKKHLLIHPSINSNQTSYLKNINEYNIQENYNLNENRLLKYKYKIKPIFDIIKNTRKEYQPQELILNKWPQFYEK